MTSTALPKNESSTSGGDDDRLEIFTLIWLDSNINVNNSIQQKFRNSINDFKHFQDGYDCQKYIEKRSAKDRLVLIVSGRLGREVVPSVHKLRQVSSIYVYCMDEKSNEQWACNFSKVKGVIVEFEELVSRIKEEYQMLKKAEEPLSTNMFSTRADGHKSPIRINDRFVFSQLFIDCFLQVKSNEMDKNELISFWSKEYESNKNELANLDQFQQSYSPDKALWWYTRDSFFYKTLNKALHSQNTQMIILFRSFIFDIHRQLQQHQSKRPCKVYRSQLISSDELENLKQYIGQFISMNSFFSTNAQRPKDILYLDNKTPSVDLEQILFEINADPGVVTTKPFADISAHSEFADKSEVLFMAGSIFRLDSVTHGDDHVWLIRMTLCGDEENDLKQVFVQVKNHSGNGEMNLQTLGKLLSKMGKFDLAEKYFTRFMNELPSNHPSLSNLYMDLAEIASRKGDLDISTKWQRLSLESKNRDVLVVSSNVGTRSRSSSSTNVLHIPLDATWAQNGVTVAGMMGEGSGFNQLNLPGGIYVDDNQTVYIADWGNHRIMEFKYGTTTGQVVAGKIERENRNRQLKYPTDLIVDKQTDSLLVCDREHRRVMRWPRQGGSNGEVIISNVACFGLAIDDEGSLYVSDETQNEVRRWRVGETSGTLVAGGNGKGSRLDQLDDPEYIFVDWDHSVYVSDVANNRVVKWEKGAKQGIVVAGGHGPGKALDQLNNTKGVVVDQLGTVYVVDLYNHRVMRWCKGGTEGSVVVGGSPGKQPNQFNHPEGLAFDRQGNLYVNDCRNHRVQKFAINSRS